MADDDDGQTHEFKLVPPHPDACQVCGRMPAHEPEQPHDASRLHYKYWFYFQHKRWPTWKDAMAHCTPAMQVAWEKELRARGAWDGDGPEKMT